MNFGIIGKALAGAGRGMAIVGQAGLNADLLAKRDAVLQSYASQNQGRDIASREKIAGEEIQARKEAAAATAGATIQSKQMEIGWEKQKQQNEQQFERSKPFKGDDGQWYQYALDGNGNVIMEGGQPKIYTIGKEPQEWKAVPDAGVKIETHSGKTESLGGATKGFMSKNERDNREYERKLFNDLRATVRGRLGEGYFEKLSSDERKQYDKILIEGAKKMREEKMPIDEAYAWAVQNFEAWQNKQGVDNGTSSNSKLESFRNKFNY